jgi:hypothetical protein
MNMIEFFEDASNLEGRQIPQSTASNSGIAATYVQGVFFETSKISKVLGPTLLNVRPLLAFLVKAETMLPGSISMLKSFLARLMISVRCRGCWALVSISYTIPDPRLDNEEHFTCTLGRSSPTRGCFLLTPQRLSSMLRPDRNRIHPAGILSVWCHAGEGGDVMIRLNRRT